MVRPSDLLRRSLAAQRKRGVRRYAYTGNEDGTVAVGDMPGHSYVRVPKGDGSFEVAIIKGQIGAGPNVPVVLEIDPHSVTKDNPDGEYYISGVDFTGVGAAIIEGGLDVDNPSVLSMAPHAPTHEYGGNDQVGLNTNQLVQLRVEPDSTKKRVRIREGVFSCGGTTYFKSYITTLDLQSYYPIAGSKFVWIAIGPDDLTTVTAATISFDEATSTIADSGSGLGAISAGDTVYVSGSTSNDGAYYVTTAGAAALVVEGDLTDEAAGASVSVTINDNITVVDDGATTYADLADEFPSDQSYVLALVMLSAEYPIGWGDIVDVRFSGDRLLHIPMYDELATVPATDDSFLIWDTSEGQHKRVSGSLMFEHEIASTAGLGSYHTAEGLVPGYVLTATSPTDAAFLPPTGGGGSSETLTISSPHWVADGAIAVANEVDGTWLVPVALTVTRVWMYLYNIGTASSTIVDIDVSTDGGNNFASIFPDPGDRPELSSSDTDHEAYGYPSAEVELTAGSILRMNIEQVATGARGLSVQLEGSFVESAAQAYNLLPLGILPMGAA